MRTTLAVLLVSLSATLWSSTAPAGVMYGWVDKNGVQNYSQLEPQGVKTEKITTRGNVSSRAEEDAKPAPATAPLKPRLTEEQQRKLDALKALHAQEEQQVADIKRTNCEKSKSVLERLKQSQRIRVREDSGTERIIGEDERQRRIEEAQQGIASNCT